MSERVSMPALGESVTEGTVTRWLKSVGDSVEVDEPLLEVSTDKVDTEIPSPVAGTLQEILAEEDETVEVGADLCVVGDGDGGDSSDSGGSDAQADEEDSQQEDSGDADESDEQEQESGDSGESQDASDSKEKSSEDTGSGDSDGSSGGGGGSEGETVTMPALGESVTEGTVTRWLKSEGDSVEVDEPLLEVSTDKVDTEIPSPVAGVLTSILAGEDETVEVGGELAVIGGESSGGSDEQASSSADEQEQAADDEQPRQETSGDASSDDSDSSDGDLAEEQDKQEQAAQEASEASGSTSQADDSGEAVGVGTTSAEAGSTSHKDADGDGTRDVEQRQQSTASTPQGQDVSAYVTPLVRKLAAQHDVDLGSLTGTGVGGRIRKQDVLDAAQAKKEQPAEAPAAQEEKAATPETSAPSGGGSPSPESEAKRGTTEKMSRLRKVIAARMVESLQTSAQLTTVIEVDVTKISRLRKRAKDEFLKREGTKLSFMPFFAMAAIEALKEHPIVNASVEDDSIVYHAAEHLASRSTPRAACSCRSSRTPVTSTSRAWHARSPTWPSAPATTRSRRTSCPAAPSP
ncbi:biotin/lipoyl-containing protein [Serinicoccus sp. CUA-874]|uniref:biotin/lipoyl-containing protein n=1 Tax=Serinicoccus sp. CUA-874 TaxID=1517939 RepID=UPI0039E0D604